MAPILLDTTVLIDLLRQRPGAVRRARALRAAGDDPYVCAINVEEAVRGLPVAHYSGARTLLSGLLNAPLRSAEGWRAGEWRSEYAARGVTLHQADCLVAAAALAVGGRLATGNPRHFPMPELTVEHWPAGE